MLNNEYARAAKNANGYIYTSPATRAMMTTTEGAPLLPEDEWKQLEIYLATSFWNNRLYNPTPFNTDPRVLEYRRFFERTIRSRLVMHLDELRRVYTALGIGFLPADRTFQMIDDAHADQSTRTTAVDESDEVETGSVNIESGERADVISEAGSKKNITDTGTPSGTSSVTSGQISTETEQYIGFNGSTPHDNTRKVSAVDPTRTIDTESFDGRTTTSTHTTGDAEGDKLPTVENEGFSSRAHTNNVNEDHDSDGESHRTVSGWGGYDIEASIVANIEIAKTCVADMIAEIIRKAVILTDSVDCRSGDSDFLIERRTWGSLSGETWGSLSDKTYKEIEEVF